jgi:hypothetical protein
MDGEEVMVALVGHVETLIVQYEDDDLFYGLREIGISGQSIGHGYILGYVDISGTALIIDQNDRLYAYSPKDALNRPWNKMTSDGAQIKIDAEHNIILHNVQRMRSFLWMNGDRY